MNIKTRRGDKMQALLKLDTLMSTTDRVIFEEYGVIFALLYHYADGLQ